MKYMKYMKTTHLRDLYTFFHTHTHTHINARYPLTSMCGCRFRHLKSVIIFVLIAVSLIWCFVSCVLVYKCMYNLTCVRVCLCFWMSVTTHVCVRVHTYKCSYSTNVVTETDHPFSLACSVTYLDVSSRLLRHLLQSPTRRLSVIWIDTQTWSPHLGLPT